MAPSVICCNLSRLIRTLPFWAYSKNLDLEIWRLGSCFFSSYKKCLLECRLGTSCKTTQTDLHLGKELRRTSFFLRIVPPMSVKSSSSFYQLPTPKALRVKNSIFVVRDTALNTVVQSPRFAYVLWAVQY